MKYLSIALLALFASTACVEQESVEVEEQTTQEQSISIDEAVAVVHATEGNSTEGTVLFTQTDDGVHVQGTISGLEADTRHGFHIHQYGDCRASDGTSAGGHFNPEGVEHGGPMDEERHVGDLGNLESNSEGEATVNFTDSKLQLGGENSILGLGVIVHAEDDDLESQPTGAAGARIGCGVIGQANPDFE